MDKTISVIIPVYNVASYLEEALRSVMSQSYQALEILVIDDGSTDSSGTICDRLAGEDSRIRVIHQKNGGAAAAKNAGLRAATGEYLSFVDSDDYLEPGAFRLMVDRLEQYEADVVQCAYRDLFTDGCIDRVGRESPEVFTTEEYLRRYTTDWTCCLLWDKLYKRALFQDIFFEEGHIVDDEFFTYQGMMNAGRVVCLPEIIYYYRKRRSSVTAKPEYRERIIMDKLDYLVQRRANISRRFPSLKRPFDEHFLDMLLWLTTDPDASARCLVRIRGMLKAYFSEPGHSPMGLSRLRPILRILTTRTEALLRRKRGVESVDLARYFV